MQTFLPYPDFEKSVQILDSKRLGKQRVETFQVLNILLDRTETKGWRNHPVTLMWKGYEAALQVYQNYTIREWIKRGYKNTMQFENILIEAQLPSWFGNESLHRSHRANLLKKDWEYYFPFFKEDLVLINEVKEAMSTAKAQNKKPNEITPYYWPVQKEIVV
jgi:hypothetical protein